MDRIEILKPLFGMALLTFLVLFRLASLRLIAISGKRISMSYFRIFRGAQETDVMAQASRNLVNLFEMPVLFFAVCFLIYLLDAVDTFAVWLAWSYVGLRAAHSLIHLTFNDVNLRFAAFFLSVVCLIVLWGRLVPVVF